MINSPSDNLAGYLDHFPFSKGIEHWIASHNDYSTLEAKQIIAGERPLTFSGIVQSRLRRTKEKAEGILLPVASATLLKFIFLYIVKRGFLDGSEGLHYAFLQSFY